MPLHTVSSLVATAAAAEEALSAATKTSETAIEEAEKARNAEPTDHARYARATAAVQRSERVLRLAKTAYDTSKARATLAEETKAFLHRTDSTAAAATEAAEALTAAGIRMLEALRPLHLPR